MVDHLDINEATLIKLAALSKLAPLPLATPETQAMQQSLNDMLALLKALQTVDTQELEPLYHPLEITTPYIQALRDDWAMEVDETSRKAAQHQAPHFKDDLYVVPKVLDA